MIAAVCEGRAETASKSLLPEGCRDVATVWLAGGRPELQTCASFMPLPTMVSAEPIFAGARAGQALAEEDAGTGSPASGGWGVIDLGQTSAKVWRAAEGVGSSDAGGVRARIFRAGRGWEALLAEALAPLRGCERLVLGLPAELTERGAGACSYFEELSFATLAATMAATLAPHLPGETLVFSDAELAGMAARRELARFGARRAPALALTLGHGVGAALVLP